VCAITIVIAILIFGLLIFIHELGHYLTARLFRVTIREFAIGMGPKLVTWTSKKTNIAYSLRLFPIGGFVSMVGEDETSDEEGALNRKPVWQRLIVTAAGSVMNILLGFVLMFAMVLTSPAHGTTVVAEFREGATSPEYGLQAKDRILEIEGTAVHNSTDVLYQIMRLGVEPLDMVVLRDGREITLNDVVFPTVIEQGTTYGDADFLVYGEHKTLGSILRNTWYQSLTSIRMIWESLFDLITGRYGIEQVSGPIGATQAIGQAAEAGSASLLYMCTLLAMNLGIFNLLPIPALDGGRLVFLWIELFRGKPIKPEYEGYVHFVGIVVLMIFMVIIAFKDIFTLL